MFTLKKIIFAAHACIINPAFAMVAPPKTDLTCQVAAIDGYTNDFFDQLSIQNIVREIEMSSDSFKIKKLVGFHSYPKPLKVLFRMQQLRQVSANNMTYDDACRLIIGLSILCEQRIQQELFASPLDYFTKEAIALKAKLRSTQITNNILKKNYGIPSEPNKKVKPARYFEYLYSDIGEQGIQEILAIIQNATLKKTIEAPSDCSSYESIISGNYITTKPSAIEVISKSRKTYIENQIAYYQELTEAGEATFITNENLKDIIIELAKDAVGPLSPDNQTEIEHNLQEYFAQKFNHYD